MKRDELLLYYERELRFIRRLAQEFAEKYPEEAGRLLLDTAKSADPHVERLIEAFAMLAARVRLKIEDDFPEVTDALLGILYPHYLAPIPSMTVVQFDLDPEQGKAAEGVPVPRHSQLHARPVDGVACTFRTAYPLRLWPIEVASTEIVPAVELPKAIPRAVSAVLRIRLRTLDGSPIAAYRIDRLLFFLHADSGTLPKLYELFALEALGVQVRRGRQGGARVRDADAIRPVGLDADEGLLDYPLESFVGYRLLQEYFAFPQKYQFVELVGIGDPPGDAASPELELSLPLRKPLSEIDVRVLPENLKLRCTPAVNLFPKRADPIRVHHRSVDYRVTPDQRALYSYEVYRITDVTSTVPGRAELRVYHPFYALRHGVAQDVNVPFWHAERTPALRKDDEGTDVSISLVDRAFRPADPGAEVLHVRALCTNRDLPMRLPFGDPAGDFQAEGRPEVSRVVCLIKPTAPLRLSGGNGARWRIISHLALNYLSIAHGRHEAARDPAQADEASLRALREILKLYDFQDSAVTRTLIDGLAGLRSRQVTRRVGRGLDATFARGVEVELEFDEEKYTATGALLFAAVLERFLGLYTSVNSFTQTIARSSQRGVFKRWPPRAGEVQVL